MGNALDAVKFKPAGETFSGEKMQKLVDATSEGLDLHRSEINNLQREKTSMIDRGDVADPGQIDISDVPENTFVKWREEGNRCMGIVLDGELVVIKGRR
jgi:hypothetical protein